MISEILVIGICVKLAVILAIVASTVGLKELRRRVQAKLFPEVKERVLLTNEVLLQYQQMLSERKEVEEDPLSEETACAWTASPKVHPRRRSSSAGRLRPRIVQAVFGPNEACGSVEDDRSVVWQKTPCVSDGESEDWATAPLSSVLQPRPEVNISKFLEAAAKRKEAKASETAAQLTEKPKAKRTRKRSALAVALERKRLNLQQTLKEALEIPKELLISQKLERINKNLKGQNSRQLQPVAETTEEHLISV